MYVCILAKLYCAISIAKTRELNSVIALPTKLVQKFLNESECAAQFNRLLQKIHEHNCIISVTERRNSLRDVNNN